MAKLMFDKIMEAINMIAYHAQKQGESTAVISNLLEAAAEMYDEKLNEE